MGDQAYSIFSQRESENEFEDTVMEAVSSYDTDPTNKVLKETTELSTEWSADFMEQQPTLMEVLLAINEYDTILDNLKDSVGGIKKEVSLLG